MKKKNDPRHRIRINTIKSLFEKSFRENTVILRNNLAKRIIKKQKNIDTLIVKHAPAWPINQIPPIDLATLRLAIWELVYKKPKNPYKVVIDEAVEIAKEFGSESSAAFVNGVLGSLVKTTNKTNT